MIRAISPNMGVKAAPLKQVQQKQNIPFEGKRENKTSWVRKDIAMAMVAAALAGGVMTSCEPDDEILPSPVIETPDTTETTDTTDIITTPVDTFVVAPQANYDYVLEPTDRYCEVSELSYPDLDGCQNILVKDTPLTQFYDLCPDGEQQKTITFDIVGNETEVNVSGTNNTVLLGGLEKSTDAKVMFFEEIKSAKVIKNGDEAKLKLELEDGKYTKNVKVEVNLDAENLDIDATIERLQGNFKQTIPEPEVEISTGI